MQNADIFLLITAVQQLVYYSLLLTTIDCSNKTKSSISCVVSRWLCSPLTCMSWRVPTARREWNVFTLCGRWMQCVLGRHWRAIRPLYNNVSVALSCCRVYWTSTSTTACFRCMMTSRLMSCAG